MLHIHLTSTTLGRALLKEYSKSLGTFCSPIYWVPTYLMEVQGPGGNLKFEVIRAGPRRNPSHTASASVRCSYGVFRRYRKEPAAEWVDNYVPQTIEGTAPGALRLWSGKGYLIHEGPPDRELSMGTAGCIEVIGQSSWRLFLEWVKPWALRKQVTFSTAGLGRPLAKLAVTAPSIVSPWAAALHKNWKGRAHSQMELSKDDVERILHRAERHKGVSPGEVRDVYLILLNYAMPDDARAAILAWLGNLGRPQRATGNRRKTALGTGG